MTTAKETRDRILADREVLANKRLFVTIGRSLPCVAARLNIHLSLDHDSFDEYLEGLGFTKNEDGSMTMFRVFAYMGSADKAFRVGTYADDKAKNDVLDYFKKALKLRQDEILFVNEHGYP